MPFLFKKLDIPEVIVIDPQSYNDERGFFVETYKYSDFKLAGISDNFIQDNHSKSVKGVIRGLHYQKEPKAQAKLVRCVQGEILDIAVDIRHGSPSYGKWVGIKLSSENRLMMYIPAGFAHGFAVISDTAELIYKTSQEYSQEDERGILWNDPELNINWEVSEPIISIKDTKLPILKYIDNNF